MVKKCYNDHNDHNADQFKIKHEPLEDYKLIYVYYDVSNASCALFSTREFFCDHCVACEKFSHWLDKKQKLNLVVKIIRYETVSDDTSVTKEEIVKMYERRIGLFAKAAK